MTSDSYPVLLLKAKIKTLKKQSRAAAIKNRWLAADDYTRRANALQEQLDAMQGNVTAAPPRPGGRKTG